ncbi:MAG: RNHCP domain-containing protein [Patescibacteria group bacterium]
MDTKRFQRTTEDFICEHCGAPVTGDGYTNHCPKCLWSKHVDINPGDRAEVCRGLMKPTHVEMERDHETLTHTCVLCGEMRRNKIQKNDSREALFEIIEKEGM